MVLLQLMCLSLRLFNMMKTKLNKAGQKKVGQVMGEYKAGKLHSGGTGKIVKNPKQAIAIAMSEAKLPMRGQRTAKNKGKK